MIDHPELKIAIAAARLGGEVLLRYLRDGVQIREKGKNDLVTTADLEAEQAITEYISERFPDHEFLAEETYTDLDEKGSANHLWIIDPLDGTTNFAHGIPHFAVSIAYFQNGNAICGVIYNPVRDELYHAVRGAGAYFQNEPIQVASETDLSDVLIGVGFYYDRGEMMVQTLKTVESLFRSEIRGIRRFGTAALDLCAVARGQYGAFFEYQLSPWDFAAGILIVEEAGGQVSTTDGRDLPLKSTTVLASNCHLHSKMLEVIQKSGS